MSGALFWARSLHHLEWCILPVPHRAKFPSLPKWKEFQTRRPTGAEFAEMFKGETGLCVICGAVSGNLVCMDFDDPTAYHAWKETAPDLAQLLPTATTGRGYHVFARLRQPVASGALFIDGFKGKAGDLLGEGKLAVLPPTVHPSGRAREWIVEPDGRMDAVTFEELGIVRKPEPTPCATGSEGWTDSVGIGERHNTLKSLAAKLRAHGHQYRFTLDMLRGVNATKCKPPLDDAEVLKLAEWSSTLAVGDRVSFPKGHSREDDAQGSNIIITPESLREDDAQDVEFGGLFAACPEYLQDIGGEDYSWVVEGLLPESYLVVLGGNSKGGKSCLLTSLSVAVATGEPFLGMATTQGAVLWVAYEESEQERAQILRMYPTPPEALFISHEKLHIDSEHGLGALRYWVRKTGARLLVIDPLYGANTAESLSDGSKARQTLAGLKELCRQEKVSAVVIHHITKNVGAGMTRERFADSNQILATASMDLLMDAEDRPDGSREIRLSGRGRGSFANQTWVIRSDSPTSFALVSVGAKSQADREARDSELLAVLSGSEGMTASEVAEATSQKVATVRNRLTELIRGNRVVCIGTRGRAQLYRANSGGQERLEGLEDSMAA